MEDGTYRLLTLVVAGAVALWNVRLHFASVRKSELAARDDKISRLKKALEDHKEAGAASRAELRERLLKVEEALDRMPSRDMVHDLGLAVEAIRGDIKAMTKAIETMVVTNRRMEDFLMHQGEPK